MPATFEQANLLDSYSKIIHFLEAHPEQWLFLQHLPEESVQKKAIAFAVAVNVCLKVLHEQIQLQATLANLAQEQRAKIEEIAKKIKELEQNRNPAQAEQLAQLKDLHKTTSQNLAQITEQFEQLNIKLANIQANITAIEQEIRQELTIYKEKSLEITRRAEEGIRNLVDLVFADPTKQKDLDLIIVNNPNFKQEALEIVQSSARILANTKTDEAILARIESTILNVPGLADQKDVADREQSRARRRNLLEQLKPMTATYSKTPDNKKESRISFAKTFSDASARAAKIEETRREEQEKLNIETLAKVNIKLEVITSQNNELQTAIVALDSLGHAQTSNNALLNNNRLVKFSPGRQKLLKETEQRIARNAKNVEKLNGSIVEISSNPSSLQNSSIFKANQTYNSEAIPGVNRNLQFTPS